MAKIVERIPEFSLVIPVFNEEACIEAVHHEIVNSLKNQSFEIIYVDDGSTDDSVAILEKKAAADPDKVFLITLYGRRGKGTAQRVGLTWARGRYVVFMDADGQDNPDNILGLLDLLEEQRAVMAVGKRCNRQSGIYYRLASGVFNLIIRSASGFKIRDINSSLKVMLRKPVTAIPIYAGHYRFLPLIIHGMGLKVVEYDVEHRPRLAGKSKYGPLKIFEGLWDMLTIFFLLKNESSPLRFFGRAGFILGLPGLGICFYITYLKLRYGYIMDKYPLLLLAILLIISGTQLFCTGLLAELIVFNRYKGDEAPPIKSISSDR